MSWQYNKPYIRAFPSFDEAKKASADYAEHDVTARIRRYGDKWILCRGDTDWERVIEVLDSGNFEVVQQIEPQERPEETASNSVLCHICGGGGCSACFGGYRILTSTYASTSESKLSVEEHERRVKERAASNNILTEELLEQGVHIFYVEDDDVPF